MVRADADLISDLLQKKASVRKHTLVVSLIQHDYAELLSPKVDVICDNVTK